MRTVSRFESDLLQILQGVFRSTARRKMLRLIGKGSDRPRCLSADAVFLVKDRLAKAAIQSLAIQGGWRNDSFLRGGQATTGRLWERTPLAERTLNFSENSLAFLIFLTACEFSLDSNSPPFEFLANPSGGDQLLVFWVYQAARESHQAAGWRSWKLFRNNPFCRLMFPQDFGKAIDEPCGFEVSFAAGNVFLWEVFQPQLASQWIAAERAKLANHSAAEVRAIGESQLFTAESFFEAAEQAGRRDLVRWFLDTARVFFAGDPRAEQWTQHLQVDGLRMAERAQAYRASISLAQLFARLDQWQAGARGIGYLDEDYRAAQFWLEMWEQYEGDALSSTAKRLIRGVDPIS